MALRDAAARGARRARRHRLRHARAVRPSRPHAAVCRCADRAGVAASSSRCATRTRRSPARAQRLGGRHRRRGGVLATRRASSTSVSSRAWARPPWVRLKAAVSLDGRTALADGASQWITGEAARADGHAWRKRACAVLTGVGTVRDDDPRLDVRLVETSRQPLRVIDRLAARRRRTRAFSRRPAEVLLYAATDEARAAPRCARAAPRSCRPTPDGKVDLPAMLAALGPARHQRAARRGGRKAERFAAREGWSTSCSSTSRRACSAAARTAALGRSSASRGLGFAFTSVALVGDDCGWSSPASGLIPGR